MKKISLLSIILALASFSFAQTSEIEKKSDNIKIEEPAKVQASKSAGIKKEASADLLQYKQKVSAQKEIALPETKKIPEVKSATTPSTTTKEE